ncbi:MAG: 3-deoxy-7-phosphoheptulonate synthase class II [Planctomycetota bacterium]
MTTGTPPQTPELAPGAGIAMDWTPTSWQTKPARQQPAYPCPSMLDSVVQQLSTLPPLVTSWEIESLKGQLAAAAGGQGFLLQGGDCAERFDECESSVIASKLKILLQMGLVLVHGANKPVIRVGRFAGQYAKPRSDDTDTRGDITLPSYRGDLINAVGFTAKEREPDPQLMLRGYERAALTLNFIRGLIDGGFADLHHPEYWDLGFVKHSPRAAEYQRMVESLGESLRFLETLSGASVSVHLPYEQAQTRQVPRRKGWYNLSTHLPWIGMRTSDLDGAHVEYCRGIRNPIAVKIGPSMTAQWLRGLLDVLHPDNEPGRLTLTHRLGVDAVADHLPQLIETVQASGKTVLWCCDPMHGNTHLTVRGVKTRNFDHILLEIEQSFEIHHRMGTYLGGVHFELTGEKLTGENVTECIGGARGLTEADLSRAYKSQVDPRLNYEQALEMAMLVARRVAEINGNRSGR